MVLNLGIGLKVFRSNSNDNSDTAILGTTFGDLMALVLNVLNQGSLSCELISVVSISVKLYIRCPGLLPSILGVFGFGFQQPSPFLAKYLLL